MNQAQRIRIEQIVAAIVYKEETPHFNILVEKETYKFEKKGDFITIKFKSSYIFEINMIFGDLWHYKLAWKLSKTEINIILTKIEEELEK
jgi:hypothetical protein